MREFGLLLHTLPALTIFAAPTAGESPAGHCRPHNCGLFDTSAEGLSAISSQCEASDLLWICLCRPQIRGGFVPLRPMPLSVRHQIRCGLFPPGPMPLCVRPQIRCGSFPLGPMPLSEASDPLWIVPSRTLASQTEASDPLWIVPCRTHSTSTASQVGRTSA